MSNFRVGCVPYVNAAPLVWWFHQPNSPIDVLYDVPSQLPRMLESGEADAILVSSIDCLRKQESWVAGGTGIISDGEVASVRIFSRKPLDQVRNLALDQSSMTSNALARIVLAEVYGAEPATKIHRPDVASMLRDCDACVIIGDKGLESDPGEVEILDLGLAWQSLTQLPFVWALWTAHRPMDSDIAELLLQAARLGSSGGGHWSSVLRFAEERSGWNQETIDHYLTHCVSHVFGEAEERGLSMFGRKLMEHGILAQSHFPHIVESTSARPGPMR